MVTYSGLNPIFAARISAAIADAEKATGGHAVVTSAYRTYADQQRAWNNYRHGGGIAAPPGKSLHEQGMAFDLAPGPVRNWIQSHASTYGLEAATATDRKKGTWGRDPPHIQLARGTLKTKYDSTPNAFAEGGRKLPGVPVDPFGVVMAKESGALPSAPARTLRKGMTGDDVSALQQQLAAKGYDIGKHGVDGKYGKDTALAVRNFEVDNHQWPADSVAGKDVRAALGSTAAPAMGPEQPGATTLPDVPPAYSPGGGVKPPTADPSIESAMSAAPYDVTRAGISSNAPSIGPVADTQYAPGGPGHFSPVSASRSWPAAQPSADTSIHPNMITPYAPGGAGHFSPNSPVGAWSHVQGEDITPPSAPDFGLPEYQSATRARGTRDFNAPEYQPVAPSAPDNGHLSPSINDIIAGFQKNIAEPVGNFFSGGDPAAAKPSLYDRVPPAVSAPGGMITGGGSDDYLQGSGDQSIAPPHHPWDAPDIMGGMLPPMGITGGGMMNHQGGLVDMPEAFGGPGNFRPVDYASAGSAWDPRAPAVSGNAPLGRKGDFGASDVWTRPDVWGPSPAEAAPIAPAGGPPAISSAPYMYGSGDSASMSGMGGGVSSLFQPLPHPDLTISSAGNKNDRTNKAVQAIQQAATGGAGPGGRPISPSSYGGSSGGMAFTGFSPWGSPTYNAPWGQTGFSNSPFTPSGWNAPDFNSKSGGSTNSWIADPNNPGHGSYINSFGQTMNF